MSWFVHLENFSAYIFQVRYFIIHADLFHPYPLHICSLLVNFDNDLFTGFVQSLEFLQKYENLQTSFPDLEKG